MTTLILMIQLVALIFSKNIKKISQKYKQINDDIVVLLNYIDNMTVRHAVGNNGGEEYDLQRIFTKLLYRR